MENLENRIVRGYKPKETRLKEIQEAIDNGANDDYEIAGIMGLEVGTIRKYASGTIELPGKRKESSQERVKQIQDAILNGAESAEEIAVRTGHSVSAVASCISYHKIKTPFPRTFYKYFRARRDEKRDELIQKRLSLSAIAKSEGVKRERVRQYLVQTDQHENWKTGRKELKKEISEGKKQKKQQLEIIANQINEVARRQVFEKDKWAYEKTEQYFQIKKWTIYSFRKIFNLLKDYHNFKEKGEKVSIEELGKRHGLLTYSISRIMRLVDEKPLACPHEKVREVLSKEKKSEIGRAFETEFCCNDVAYFLGTPFYNISLYFTKYLQRGKRHETKHFVKRFGSRGNSYLTYYKASEIFQARDLGFNRDETLELLDVDGRVYDYAIQNQGEIIETIVRNLRIIFPERQIQRPYIER